MASCNIILFEELGGSPSEGGSWTQVSGPQQIIITQGYLGNVDLSTVDQGTYVFRYTLPIDPNTSSTVTVEVGDKPNPGQNTIINVADSDSVITLIDQLDGSPDAGGVWTLDLTPSNGIVDLLNGTYDPELGDGSNEGNTYTFTYSVTKPGTDSDCDCCTQSSTLRIKVFSGNTIGTDATINVCASDLDQPSQVPPINQAE